MTRPISSRIVFRQRTIFCFWGRNVTKYFLNEKLVLITLPLNLVCIWNPNAIITMNWLPSYTLKVIWTESSHLLFLWDMLNSGH